MIAVAIIGIAAAVAIPNFTRMYIDYEARATASEITRLLVNGVVQMTTTNLAGAPALQGVTTVNAGHMTPLVFNNGAIANGGVVQFNSYGIRTSVPGTGVQNITIGGTLGGVPTAQYRVNIAPSGTSGLVRV
jgi:Tfp pilus assembly major pilin PilA